MSEIKSLFNNRAFYYFILDGLIDIGGLAEDSQQLMIKIFNDNQNYFNDDKLKIDEIIRLKFLEKFLRLNNELDKLHDKELNYDNLIGNNENKIRVGDNLEFVYFNFSISHHAIGLMMGKRIIENDYFVILFNTGLAATYAKVSSKGIAGITYFMKLTKEKINSFIKTLFIFTKKNIFFTINNFYYANVSCLLNKNTLSSLFTAENAYEYLFENIDVNSVNSNVKICYMTPQYSGNCSFLWVYYFPVILHLLNDTELMNNEYDSITIVNKYNEKMNKLRLYYYEKILDFIQFEGSNEKIDIEQINFHVVDFLFVIENNVKKYIETNMIEKEDGECILKMIKNIKINKKDDVNLNNKIYYDNKNINDEFSLLFYSKKTEINFNKDLNGILNIDNPSLEDLKNFFYYFRNELNSIYKYENDNLFHLFLKKYVVHLLNVVFKNIGKLNSFMPQNQEEFIDIKSDYTYIENCLTKHFFDIQSSNYPIFLRYIVLLMKYNIKVSNFQEHIKKSNFLSFKSILNIDDFNLNLKKNDTNEKLFNAFFSMMQVYDKIDIENIDKFKTICEKIGDLICFVSYSTCFISYKIISKDYSQIKITSLFNNTNDSANTQITSNKLWTVFDYFNYSISTQDEIIIFLFNVHNEFDFIKNIIILNINNFEGTIKNIKIGNGVADNVVNLIKHLSNEKFVPNIDLNIMDDSKINSSLVYNINSYEFIDEKKKHVRYFELLYNNDNLFNLINTISNFYSNEKYYDNEQDINITMFNYCGIKDFGKINTEETNYYPIVVYDKNWNIFAEKNYSNMIKSILGKDIAINIYGLYILFLCVYICNLLNENIDKEIIKNYINKYEKKIMSEIDISDWRYIYSNLFIGIICLTLDIDVDVTIKKKIYNIFWGYSFSKTRFLNEIYKNKNDNIPRQSTFKLHEIFEKLLIEKLLIEKKIVYDFDDSSNVSEINLKNDDVFLTIDNEEIKTKYHIEKQTLLEKQINFKFIKKIEKINPKKYETWNTDFKDIRELVNNILIHGMDHLNEPYNFLIEYDAHDIFFKVIQVLKNKFIMLQLFEVNENCKWIPFKYFDIDNNCVNDYYFNLFNKNILIYDNDIKLKLIELNLQNHFVLDCKFTLREDGSYEIINPFFQKYIFKGEINKLYTEDSEYELITFEQLCNIYPFKVFLLWNFFAKNEFIDNILIWKSEKKNCIKFELKSYNIIFSYDMNIDKIYLDKETQVFINDPIYGTITKKTNDVDQLYINRFLNGNNVILSRNKYVFKLIFFNFPFVKKKNEFFFDEYHNNEFDKNILKRNIVETIEKYHFICTTEMEEKNSLPSIYNVELNGELSCNFTNIEQCMIGLLNFKNSYNFDIITSIINFLINIDESNRIKVFNYLNVLNKPRNKTRIIDDVMFRLIIDILLNYGHCEHDNSTITLQLFKEKYNIVVLDRKSEKREYYEKTMLLNFCNEIQNLITDDILNFFETKITLNSEKKSTIIYDKFKEYFNQKHLLNEELHTFDHFTNSCAIKYFQLLFDNTSKIQDEYTKNYVVFLGKIVELIKEIYGKFSHENEFLYYMILQLNDDSYFDSYFRSQYYKKYNIHPNHTTESIELFNIIQTEIETMTHFNDFYQNNILFINNIFTSYCKKIFLNDVDYFKSEETKNQVIKKTFVKELIYLINYSSNIEKEKYIYYEQGCFSIRNKFYIYDICENYKVNINKYKDFLNNIMTIQDFKEMVGIMDNKINKRNIDLTDLEKEDIDKYVNKIKKIVYIIKKVNLNALLTTFCNKLFLLEKERIYFVNKFKISLNINILEHLFNKPNDYQFVFLYYLNIIHSYFVKTIQEILLLIESNNEIIDITNINNGLQKINLLIKKNNDVKNILFFIELTNGFILNDDQYEYLDNALNNLKDKNQHNHFQEILMGKGKSSVIIPTIAIANLLNNNNKNVFVFVPQNLIKQTYKYLVNSISSYFPIGIFTIDNIESNSTLLEKENCIFVMSCETIRDFIINNYNDIRYDKISFKNSLCIIDEIHLICDPMNCETNIIDKSENLLQKLSPTNNSNFIFESLFNLVENLYFEEKFTFENTETIGHKIFKDFDFDFLIKNHKNLIVDLVIKMFGGNEKFIELFKKFEDGSFKEYLLSFVKEYIDIQTLYYRNFIYSVFYVSLPNMCNMANNKNFGLFNDKKMKSFFVVCPFLSLNTPLGTSEFSDYYMSIMLTIISYLNNNVRIEDLEIFLDFCITKIKMSLYDENTKFFKLAKKYYNELYGIDISKSSIETNLYSSQKYKLKSNLINKDNEKIKKEFIRNYLILYVFPTYFSSLTTTQTNFTNYDFLSDLLTRDVLGYTGTLQTIMPPLVYKNQIKINKRENINSEICFGLGNMMEEKVEIKHINNNDIVNSNLLNEIIKILKIEQYNALIDVGGLLIQFNTIEIMKEFYINLHDNEKYKNINCFVFILDDEKYIYNADGSYIKFNDSPCSVNNIFVYYSNTYITGIDFKLKPNALGLVTVKNDTPFETLSQGGYRMRRLNPIGHQTLNYVIFNNDEIKTFKDLIEMTIKNQHKLYKNKNNLYKYQLSKSFVRNTFTLNDEIKTTFGNKSVITDKDSIIKTINEMNYDKYHKKIENISSRQKSIYNEAMKKIDEIKDGTELSSIQINISKEISEEMEKTINITETKKVLDKVEMLKAISFKNIVSFDSPNFFGYNLETLVPYDSFSPQEIKTLSKYISDNNISDENKLIQNNLYMSPYVCCFIRGILDYEILSLEKILLKNTFTIFIILVNINNLNTTSIIISLEEFLFMCNKKDVKYELTKDSSLYAVDIYGNVFKFNVAINNFELQPIDEITKNTQLRYNSHITLFLAMYEHNYIEYDRIIHLYYRFKFIMDCKNICCLSINDNINKNKFFYSCRKQINEYGIILQDDTIDHLNFGYKQTQKREDVTGIVKEITKNFDAVINGKQKLSKLDFSEPRIKNFIKQLICENDDCENIDFDNFNDIEMLNSIIKTIKYFKSLDEAVQKGGLSKYYKKYLKYKSKYLKLKKLTQ